LLAENGNAKFIADIMSIKISFFILIFSLRVSAEMAFSPQYTYDSTDSLLWRGISRVYDENFHAALATFDSVIRQEPSSPRGYFFVAAAYSNLTGDYRNLSYAAKFLEHVNKAIEIGAAKDKSDSATADDLFYYGGAVGYRGIYRSFTGDWVGAFRDGLRGRSLLKRSFEADDTNKDIYLGLGTYDYWRSAMTKILWWMPFFSDKRERGIQEILVAAENAKFSSLEAAYALVRIYYDYEKYDELFELWESKLKEMNPIDPFANYWLGLAYLETGQFDRALESFQTILNVYLKSQYYDAGGEMEARYYIGLALSRQGRYDEALEHLQKSSELTRGLKGRKDIEKALDNVNSLLKEVKKKSSVASQ